MVLRSRSNRLELVEYDLRPNDDQTSHIFSIQSLGGRPEIMQVQQAMTLGKYTPPVPAIAEFTGACNASLSIIHLCGSRGARTGCCICECAVSSIAVRLWS